MLRRALLAAVIVATPASAKPANDSGMVQDERESLTANRADVSPQADAVSASYKDALLFRGAREDLYDRGIDLHLIYTTESSSGLTEGARGTRYTGQIEFGGKFDLDKLAGLKGATVNVVLVNREGRDLSTDKIHNLFRVQEVFGANKDLRLVYLTYRQKLAGGAIDILVGRTNIGQDFAYSKLYCNFQNNGLCGRPRSLPANGGFSNYPLSAWGGRIRVKPFGGDSYIQTGAYEVNPDLAARNGFQFSFHGDTGVVLPVEAAWVRGNEKTGTLGTFKLGGYYDTSRTSDVLRNEAGLPVATAGGLPLRHRGRTTFYAFADQMVARFGGDPKRPLILLAGVAYAPPDRSLIRDQWYAAVLAKGPIASRPGDTLGLLALSGRVSPDVAEDERLLLALGQDIAVQRRETVFEINYTVRLANWLHITPGAQEIVHPAADPTRRNAKVLDLKTVLNF